MGRNIVVCLDGTRNKPSDERRQRDTHAWKFHAALSALHQGREPHCVYVRGVGTLPEPAKQQPAQDLRFARIRQWLPPVQVARRQAQRVVRLPRRIALRYGAAAVGWGVADRIREAYAYLCEHYRPGDHVYLFGFSRGAFEARSLAGFVDRVGLLLLDKARGPDPRRLVDIAYDLYRRGDDDSLAFLRRFLRRVTGRAAPVPGTEVRRWSTVDLHFVGVWDTVAALGLGELNERVPLVGRHVRHHLVAGLPACVRHGRHALALHELRHRFEPTPWTESTPGQDIVQCWFAGAHADVGGGYPEPGLALHALHWMADEAAATSACTSSPLRFVGLPPLAAGAGPALPHHAIQGEFFWMTPTPRAALHGGDAWVALAGETTIHPSALARLFDSASTSCVDHPYRKDLRWAERLPDGRKYPPDVAGALHWIDDRTVQLRLQALPGRTPPPAGVVELRALDEWLRNARPQRGAASFTVPLGDAIAWLIAFGREATVRSFVQRVEAEVESLVVGAAASTQAGLDIRLGLLPWFSAACRSSEPPQGLPIGTIGAAADSAHDALCRAALRLRGQLPIQLLRVARFRPRGPAQR